MSDDAAKVTVDVDSLGDLFKRLILVSVVSAPVVAAGAVAAAYLFDGSSGTAAVLLVGVPMALFHLVLGVFALSVLGYGVWALRKAGRIRDDEPNLLLRPFRLLHVLWLGGDLGEYEETVKRGVIAVLLGVFSVAAFLELLGVGVPLDPRRPPEPVVWMTSV